MPGVIEIRTDIAIGKAIDDICLILDCSTAEDLDGQIYYIPL
jgi:hypothetical protein